MSKMVEHNTVRRGTQLSVLRWALAPAAALSLTACATAQDKQEAPREVTHEITTESQDGETKSKSSSVKIISKTENGEETVELWINGEKTDARTQEDVERILKERGLDNVRINIGGSGRAHAFVMPEIEGLIKLQGLEGLEGLEGLKELERFQVLGGDNMAGNWLALSDATPPKSMLGVTMKPVSEEVRDYLGLSKEEGVLVGSIVDDSPASKIDLKPNDLIIGAVVEGKERQKVGMDSLRKLIAESEPGTRIELQYLRAGKPMSASVELDAYKADVFGETAPMAPGGQWRLMQPGGDRLIEIAPMREMLLERSAELRSKEEILRTVEKQLEETRRMLEELRKEQAEETNKDD